MDSPTRFVSRVNELRNFSMLGWINIEARGNEVLCIRRFESTIPSPIYAEVQKLNLPYSFTWNLHHKFSIIKVFNIVQCHLVKSSYSGFVFFK